MLEAATALREQTRHFTAFSNEAADYDEIVGWRYQPFRERAQ